MEAGLTDHVWSLEVVGLLDAMTSKSSGMTESQIDRIRKAEEAIRQLVQVAAQIRQEADKLPIEDPAVRKELLETAEGLEIQAQDLRKTLREWREDIH
jgi:hypothetical protein